MQIYGGVDAWVCVCVSICSFIHLTAFRQAQLVPPPDSDLDRIFTALDIGFTAVTIAYDLKDGLCSDI